MERKENLKLVRIFIGESDKCRHKALYEEIVFLAKKTELAGATVTRGIMGFGAHSVVHKSKMLELSNDLPIIIEVVDTDDNGKYIEVDEDTTKRICALVKKSWHKRNPMPVFVPKVKDEKQEGIN